MMLPGYLFNLPTPTNFITSTGVWSSALYNEFEDLIFYIIGIGFFVMVLTIVIRAIKH